LAGSFAGHFSLGHPPQFIIDQRQQRFGGLRITILDGLKNLGEIAQVARVWRNRLESSITLRGLNDFIRGAAGEKVPGHPVESKGYARCGVGGQGRFTFWASQRGVHIFQ